jgi:hypothetical protein
VAIGFTISKEVSDSACAWKAVANIGQMPRYWRGHREVNVMGYDGHRYYVSIRFAFPGPLNKGLASVLINDVERYVTVEYTEGPVRGDVTTRVQGGKVITVWEVKLAWYLRLLEPWVKGHFMKGASDALERIASECSKGHAVAGSFR